MTPKLLCYVDGHGWVNVGDNHQITFTEMALAGSEATRPDWDTFIAANEVFKGMEVHLFVRA